MCIRDSTSDNSDNSDNGDNSYNGDNSDNSDNCLLYTSPSPRDGLLSRMPSSAWKMKTWGRGSQTNKTKTTKKEKKRGDWAEVEPGPSTRRELILPQHH